MKVSTGGLPGPLAQTADAVRAAEGMGYDEFTVGETKHDSMLNATLAVANSERIGVGTFTLLTSLTWARMSRIEVDEASSAAVRRALLEERNQKILAAQVIAGVSAAVAITGIVLLATGSVKKRRAVEEARGRVYMQAAPGGMQVRF